MLLLEYLEEFVAVIGDLLEVYFFDQGNPDLILETLSHVFEKKGLSLSFFVELLCEDVILNKRISTSLANLISSWTALSCLSSLLPSALFSIKFSNCLMNRSKSSTLSLPPNKFSISVLRSSVYFSCAVMVSSRLESTISISFFFLSLVILLSLRMALRLSI